MRRLLVLPVLLTSTFVVTLDFFIVNVALPSMQSELDATSADLQLWVAGYGVTLGALLILGAKLGDRHGRRRVFGAGLTLFTTASAACGLAPGPTFLVFARVAQGVGAALMMPQVLGTIGATMEGETRARAIGAYGLTAGLAAVSGQLIGGALIDLDVAGLGWRACFLVNVPVGLAALAALRAVVPETRAPRVGGVDLPSVALVSAGLALVVIPVVEGRELHWPLWTWAALVAADGLLVAFGLRQRRLVRAGREPLIDPSLWRHGSFAAGTLANLAFQLGVASSFFVLALFLQGGMGLDPVTSGLVFAIFAAGYLVSSLLAPALTARAGARRSLTIGSVVSAAGWVELALTASDGATVGALVPGLATAGVGMGLLFAPLVTATVSTVPIEQAGSAAGVVSTVQQVGGALGVALLGIVFYGALGAGSPADHADAFQTSAWCLAALSVPVAVLLRFLPGRAAPVPAAAPEVGSAA